MADNRMWLVHRPTGLGVLLGKRLGYPWGAHPDVDEKLNELFEAAEYSDDYILLMESDKIPWKYTMEFQGRLRKFDLEDSGSR